MATKLQKQEVSSILRKYGYLDSVKKKWWDVTLVPYHMHGVPRRKFRSSRKVEYLALKEIKRNIHSALLWEVRLIEAKMSKPDV